MAKVAPVLAKFASVSAGGIEDALRTGVQFGAEQPAKLALLPGDGGLPVLEQ